MTTVYLVLVDNGDSEPEVWAFEREEDAEMYVEVRGGGKIQSVAVLDAEAADAAIRDELEGI